MLRVEPHPGLLLVAAVAVRHGLREGMMTTVTITGLAVAAFMHVGGAVALAALGQPRTWLAPFLLALTGFVLGVGKIGCKTH